MAASATRAKAPAKSPTSAKNDITLHPVSSGGGAAERQEDFFCTCFFRRLQKIVGRFVVSGDACQSGNHQSVFDV